MPDAPAAEPSAEFHDLIVLNLPSLRQQAMALTRNRTEADDLLQATIVSALAARESFTIGTNFRAWMHRILRNRFVSNIRRRRETVDLDDAPAALLVRSGGQLERLDILELRRCLLRLPANQRLILLMISLQGLSYEEASVQTGVSVGTLKCRVFRARAQLSAWMLGEERAPEGAAADRMPGAAPPIARRRRRNGHAVSLRSSESGAFTPATADRIGTG